MRHFIYNIVKAEIYCSRKGPQPTVMYEDNQSAIALTEHPVLLGGSKHISVRYHAVRDIIARGEISVQSRETETMVADGFTKALAAPATIMFRKQLGLR